jgi:hypothetical protein
MFLRWASPGHHGEIAGGQVIQKYRQGGFRQDHQIGRVLATCW